MHKVRSLTTLSLVTTVALFGFGLFWDGGPSQVRAEDVNTDTLTVSPPRFELFGNPGDTVVEKLRVRNDGTSTLSYNAQVEDFKAQGDEGGVALLDPSNPEDSSNTFTLARWVTVEPARFTLDGGKDKILEVAIKIPKDAEPGGHFASVLIRRAGTTSPGGAAVETRVGSLILFRVSGNITESANIDYFKAQESIQQYGPVTFDLRVQNTGNAHVAPQSGKVIVTNLFGKKVAEIPFLGNNVLPGSARIMRVQWDERNLIGRYTATFVANYGQTNGADGPKTLSATTAFIVFPLYLLWILIGVIVVIALMITQRKQLKKLINRLTSD